jgi:hypothetical protein
MGAKRAAWSIAAPGREKTVLVYALSIFVSAFLLFQVQPLVGKFLLPWFGGTPAVWSTALLFFQILLTGGYSYAYWLMRRRDPRRQVGLHVSLLLVSLVGLTLTGIRWPSPLMPGPAWKPTGAELPVPHIFVLLAISVGLPYFLLATNSPLMQAWFSRALPDRSPYWLYALSNTGSLLGLLSYPVLVEPTLPLRSQGWAWAGGYLLFALLAGGGAVWSVRGQAAGPPVPSAESPGSAPSRHVKLLWILLSACASLMLLAMTNQLTQEVAVIPFLWVLPLSLYLLSFILAFSSERWYPRRIFEALLAVATIAFLWGAFSEKATIVFQIAAGSFLLFVVCMICNGELYRLRPAPRYLTSFYLMGSIGGALGGIFVSLVAPLIFDGYWELYIGLLFAWLLVVTLMHGTQPAGEPGRARHVVRLLLVFLAAATGLLVGVQSLGTLLNLPLIERSFYGVISVNERDPGDEGRHRFTLVHGQTVHGVQFVEALKRALPTTYYTAEGGGGLAILNHPKYGHGLRVGVLGEGIGTLAAYGQPGDTYRFYEINPGVMSLAEGRGGYFSYLEDSRARVDTVLGDARISLERELASGDRQEFDVLILDTFSSDSIPVHLLTREAFALYLQHLAPGGIIAAHISNNHLELAPVLQQVASALGLSAVDIQSPGDQDMSLASEWVLLARDPALLRAPGIARHAEPLAAQGHPIRLWTDDYSNLFQILR